MITINETKLTAYVLVDKVDKDGQRVRRTSTSVKDKNKIIFHCHECSHSKTIYTDRGKLDPLVEYACNHPVFKGQRLMKTAYVSPIPKWCPIGNFQ